ncbi:hypothetical protein ACLB2K_070514 [Fragaria x ananassa]
MTSYDDAERVDQGIKEGKHEEEEGDKFIDKVKDFIHDLGEKIKGAIGFCKPAADVAAVHIPCIHLEDAGADELMTWVFNGW